MISKLLPLLLTALLLLTGCTQSGWSGSETLREQHSLSESDGAVHLTLWDEKV